MVKLSFTCHEGIQGQQMYRFTHYYPQHYMVVSMPQNTADLNF